MRTYLITCKGLPKTKQEKHNYKKLSEQKNLIKLKKKLKQNNNKKTFQYESKTTRKP